MAQRIPAETIGFPFRLVMMIGAALVCGCGSPLQTARPVDPAQAVQALETTLETWKTGGTAADLRARDPEIVAQDVSWSRGERLVDYEMLGEHRAVDANLYCDVRLRLSSPKGKDHEATVTYIVGTDPVLTVFRQMP